MKKWLAILLALVMVFTLAACGGGGSGDEGGNDGGNNEFKGKTQDDFEWFSVEGAQFYLQDQLGIDFADLEPGWEYTIPEYYAFSDGDNASVTFFKADGGELSDEEMDAYWQKVFDVTAGISQDGYNIIGWEFVGEGENAMSEVTFEEAKDSWMPGWGFRYNDTFYVVYLEDHYDTEKDSTIDPYRLYYDGVGFDIGTGLQKSFDDTWDEMEEYFEENEDEIKDALEDFLE